jgi:hypothetical protein
MRAEELIENWYELQRNLSLQVARDFILEYLKLEFRLRQNVRIQVFDWGIREGMKKLQEWADIASRKKAIALLP